MIVFFLMKTTLNPSLVMLLVCFFQLFAGVSSFTILCARSMAYLKQAMARRELLLAACLQLACCMLVACLLHACCMLAACDIFAIRLVKLANNYYYYVALQGSYNEGSSAYKGYIMRIYIVIVTYFMCINAVIDDMIFVDIYRPFLL